LSDRLSLIRKMHTRGKAAVIGLGIAVVFAVALTIVEHGRVVERAITTTKAIALKPSYFRILYDAVQIEGGDYREEATIKADDEISFYLLNEYQHRIWELDGEPLPPKEAEIAYQNFTDQSYVYRFPGSGNYYWVFQNKDESVSKNVKYSATRKWSGPIGQSTLWTNMAIAVGSVILFSVIVWLIIMIRKFLKGRQGIFPLKPS